MRSRVADRPDGLVGIAGMHCVLQQASVAEQIVADARLAHLLAGVDNRVFNPESTLTEQGVSAIAGPAARGARIAALSRQKQARASVYVHDHE